MRYFIGRLTTGVFNVKCKILDKEMEIYGVETTLYSFSFEFLENFI